MAGAEVMIALVAAAAPALAGLVRGFLDSRRTRSFEIEIDKLEQQIERERTAVEYVKAVLELASERQRLATFAAERSGRNLFWLGTVLTILSVCVPFVLVAMYMRTDPLLQLGELKRLGIDPRIGVELVKRDWHLLAAGVSFGLLFLAAARGALNAEIRQRALYARESRIVAYYGDLIRALEVAARIDDERKDEAKAETSRVMVGVVDRLLLTPRTESEPGTAEPGEATNSELAGTVRSIAEAAARHRGA